MSHMSHSPERDYIERLKEAVEARYRDKARVAEEIATMEALIRDVAATMNLKASDYVAVEHEDDAGLTHTVESGTMKS